MDPETPSAMWAALVGVSGAVLATTSALFAQVTTSGGAELWVSSASSLSAVGALVYIARQFGNGSLVARQPAEAERKLSDVSDRLMELVEAAHRREELLLEELRHAKQ